MISKNCVKVCILFILVFSFLVNIQAEDKVLARVDVSGQVNELGLPVLAHLEDASGKDYG